MLLEFGWFHTGLFDCRSAHIIKAIPLPEEAHPTEKEREREREGEREREKERERERGREREIEGRRER